MAMLLMCACIGPAKPVVPPGPVIKVGQTESFGAVLVAENGMTLYMYDRDADGVSVCYDECAQLWPPLLSEGAPVAATGVQADLLGTTRRNDGKLQVTYNKMPLYFWIRDRKLGDGTGQRVAYIWFVVTPDHRCRGGGNG